MKKQNQELMRGDKRIADLFTKGSDHQNLSVIYIVQNIFQQGRETRNISLNARYIVLFKSPQDKQQICLSATSQLWTCSRIYEKL